MEEAAITVAATIRFLCPKKPLKTCMIEAEMSIEASENPTTQQRVRRLANKMKEANAEGRDVLICDSRVVDVPPAETVKFVGKGNSQSPLTEESLSC